MWIRRTANLPPSWRRNGKRRRRKSREESVLDFIMTRLYASYTCVHGRKKCWKGYTGKGDGDNYRTKRRGPGWQTGELSIIRTLLYDLERLPGSLTTPILFYELDLDRIARFSHGNARFKNDSIVHWLIMVRLFDDIWIRWSRWEKMWILWMIMDG